MVTPTIATLVIKEMLLDFLDDFLNSVKKF